MRSYRDFLDDRGVKPGPWVTLADGRPAYAREKLGDPQEGATCCQPSASAGQVAVFAEWHQAQKGRGR